MKVSTILFLGASALVAAHDGPHDDASTSTTVSLTEVSSAVDESTASPTFTGDASESTVLSSTSTAPFGTNNSTTSAINSSGTIKPTPTGSSVDDEDEDDSDSDAEPTGFDDGADTNESGAQGVFGPSTLGYLLGPVVGLAALGLFA